MAQDVRPDDRRGLRRFRAAFSRAKAHLCPGNRRFHDRGSDALPFAGCVTHLDRWM